MHGDQDPDLSLELCERNHARTIDCRAVTVLITDPTGERGRRDGRRAERQLGDFRQHPDRPAGDLYGDRFRSGDLVAERRDRRGGDDDRVGSMRAVVVVLGCFLKSQE